MGWSTDFTEGRPQRNTNSVRHAQGIQAFHARWGAVMEFCSNGFALGFRPSSDSGTGFQNFNSSTRAPIEVIDPRVSTSQGP